MKSHSSDNEVDLIAAEFKDYAFSVSHDLSAPVRAMVEFSKLLSDEHHNVLNIDSKEYLGIIIENGQKLQTMMAGLLAYSRLNTMAKPFVSVDFAAVIRECCQILEQKISVTQAIIEVGEMPILEADYEQITQLFSVLLDNALKFQIAGVQPKISISAKQIDGVWLFAVEDNGIGVLPQYQDKIFKLFTRLNMEEEYSGVGIGLTLAQKIVQRHGGRIWCESYPEGGCCFYFTLFDTHTKKKIL